MPEVFRIGALVFFFYANEGNEPMHVHVRRGSARTPDAEGKWWLSPLAQAYAEGFTPADLRMIRHALTARRKELLDAWNRTFPNRKAT